MRQVKSDEARRTFRELLSEVEYHGEHVEILRYKTPSAVLVPVEWHTTASAALGEEHGIFVSAEWYERAKAALEQVQREEQGR